MFIYQMQSWGKFIFISVQIIGKYDVNIFYNFIKTSPMFTNPLLQFAYSSAYIIFVTYCTMQRIYDVVGGTTTARGLRVLPLIWWSSLSDIIGQVRQFLWLQGLVPESPVFNANCLVLTSLFLKLGPVRFT